MGSKLKELHEKCKAGVYVEINPHKDEYQKLYEYLLEHDIYNEMEAEVLEKMLKDDSFVSVQFYPDTPIGFYRVIHHDVDEALAEALGILEENQRGH